MKCNCSNCNKKIDRKPNEVAKYDKLFCSACKHIGYAYYAKQAADKDMIIISLLGKLEPSLV